MSFCVYTILYTLEDKKPEENEYVQIFLLWLSQISKMRVAKTAFLLIDSRTFSFLETNLVFNRMIEKTHMNVEIQTFPPPKTYMDGMKVKFTKFDYEEDYLIFLDLDILVLNPLKDLISRSEKCQFYVHLEHSLFVYEYTSAMTPDEKCKLKDANLQRGLSSGKFIIGCKSARDQIFDNILAFIDKMPPTTFLTVEQPIFNRVLFLDSSNIKVGIIDNSKISQNLNNYSDDTVLLDYYGDTCNGKRHLQKMVEFVAYQNMRCG